MKNEFDINELIYDADLINDAIYALGTYIINSGYDVHDDFDPNDVKNTIAVHPVLFDALKDCSFDFVPGGKINAKRLEKWYDYKDNGNRTVWVFDYTRYNIGDKLLAVVRQPSDIMEGWDSEDQTYFDYDCGSALVVAWISKANV